MSKLVPGMEHGLRHERIELGGAGAPADQGTL
jgi:hypothetical protein